MSTIITSTNALTRIVQGWHVENISSHLRILLNTNKTNKREAEFENLCKHKSDILRNLKAPEDVSGIGSI